MTDIELSRRQFFINIAKTYVGVNEADGSHEVVIDLYNSIRPLPRAYKMSYTDPWCAAFPSAVGEECGMGDVIFPECSCDAMISLYKSAGRFVEADNHVPSIGDLLMYDWDDSGSGDNRGSADHVGIVTEVIGSEIVVLEGNISDKVGYRRIAVNAKHIRGYCCPDFAGSSALVPESVPDTIDPVIVAPKPESSFEMNAPFGRYLPAPFRILRPGMSGPDVKSLQQLLIAKGYDCGLHKDDGHLGNDTAEALKQLQEDNGLYADGEFGPESHRVLWG